MVTGEPPGLCHHHHESHYWLSSLHQCNALQAVSRWCHASLEPNVTKLVCLLAMEHAIAAEKLAATGGGTIVDTASSGHNSHFLYFTSQLKVEWSGGKMSWSNNRQGSQKQPLTELTTHLVPVSVQALDVQTCFDFLSNHHSSVFNSYIFSVNISIARLSNNITCHIITLITQQCASCAILPQYRRCTFPSSTSTRHQLPHYLPVHCRW